MVEITYFAHSTTYDNENGIATGWLPGELSPTGIEQAKALGDMVADQHFDVVFCSDLKRAVDSAELGFGGKYKIVQDKRLREANYGDFNGKPHTFKDSTEAFVETPFPNGQSYKEVEYEIRSFCDFLTREYPDSHVAIVAHEAPQLALDVVLSDRTWQQAIDENWRKTKSWQPGWRYTIPD